jgi:alpha-glucosidase
MKPAFESFGKIESSRLNKGQLLFQSENATIRISQVSDHCLQIYAIRKGETFLSHSFAAEQLEFEAIQTLHDGKEQYSIKGNAFDCLIDKSSSAIQFRNKRGKIILSDDPGLGTRWHGTGFICHKKLNEGERFIGLGEKTGPLDKRGKTYVNRNTDFFGYAQNSDPIYASIPFYLGINGDQIYGIFLDNTSYTQFDFGTSNKRFASFSAPEGPLRYYFFYGDTVQDIVKAYTKLTGSYPLPPIWALGYQQCRYSYYPMQEVLTLSQVFTEKNIPIDLIYLDIHYMDEYKVFTWDPKHFSEPEKMMQKLGENNVRLAIIMDPGIKVEEGYEPYDEGVENDYFVKYIDGERYEGEVWPGVCHFPDFTDNKVRQWWGTHVMELFNQGLRGFWHDMNEPAVWGNQFPTSTVFQMDGSESGFISARNIYGMQMCKASWQGLSEVNERYFSLTRAAYSGSQRYTAIWTGDNTSNQEHLHMSAAMVANLSMCGFPMAGSDIGGFVGECSPELYMRWIAMAAFQPLFRGHTMINSKDAEPWSFGEEAEEVARNYIQLRYRLLPYWYSLFRQYTLTHIPPVQSLAMLYPMDPLIYDSRFENQFMLGETFLITPGRIDQEFFELYLPEGVWYDFYSGKKYKGGQVHILKENKHFLPIFIKDTGLFVCWEKQNYRATETQDTLEVHIYDISADKEFLWYEDDGISFDYRKEKFAERSIIFDAKSKKLHISSQKGKLVSPVTKVHLYLHIADKLNDCRINGKSVKPSISDYCFVDQVSRFDPFYIPAENDKILFGSTKIEIDINMNDIIVEFITT